jgi:hypothetical protein
MHGRTLGAHTVNEIEDPRPPLPLDTARLCPDCDILTENAICPVCDRAQTFPLAVWLIPLHGAFARPWVRKPPRSRLRKVRPSRLPWSAKSEGEPTPRWLVVVRAGEWELYHYLQRRFESMEDVGVIIDRRKGERRQPRAGGAPGERRGDQRRRPLSRGERDWWEAAGFRIVARAVTFQLYMTPGR